MVVNDSLNNLISSVNQSGVVSLLPFDSVGMPDSVYRHWLIVHTSFNQLSGDINGLLAEWPTLPLNGVFLDLLNTCLKTLLNQGVSDFVGDKMASLPDRNSFELLNSKLYGLIGNGVVDILRPLLYDSQKVISKFYDFSVSNRDKIFGSPVHPLRLKHCEQVLSINN